MTTERIKEVRKLHEECEQARGVGFSVRARPILFYVPDLLDIADAYRWRPVEELTEEAQWGYEIVWGMADHTGIVCTATGWAKKAAVALGYTHFLRLPKMEAL